MIRPIVNLGVFKGRAIGLVALVFSFLLLINPAPSKFFMETGWATNPEDAFIMQRTLNDHFWAWRPPLLYMVVFLFRKETLHLLIVTKRL